MQVRAIPIEPYRQGRGAAGFAHVVVIDSKADLNARFADLLQRYDVNDDPASVKGDAGKPR